ncbi:hypothetical protein ABIA32_006175 [Streptacidiphilus sp. MAP12-20]|uniref:serine protease n=1 Tax=Streptacidiphilus sp. MAP12-20 TaxID=3156299 RepID=UPI003519CE03
MGPGLVRVGDTRGAPRGLAFAGDREGTLLTAHEVVDGLTGVVLTYADGSSVRVRAERIVALPSLGLALIRSETPPPGGPWPLAGGAGTRLVALHGLGPALQGGIAGLVTARYEASERFWLVPDVWLLTVGQAPYGLPVHAAGGPVVDAESGAVVGVATVALRSRRRGAVLAVPLGTAAAEAVLADLLARNAETVPAHGRALNLAGVLELAAAGIGPAATVAAARRVPRPDGLPEAAEGWDPVRPVLALVGDAGSGRTTELAALALQRTRAAYRLPTLWLRGAELEAGDASLLDAVDRALRRAHALLGNGGVGPLAGQVARVAAAAHRPLLIVVDSPEEAPPELHARWRAWCTETVRRLRRLDGRLVLGCLPEFWERMGAAFGPDDLHGCHPLGRLDRPTAAALAARADAAGWQAPAPVALLAAGDPVALRLLGELRSAQPALALSDARVPTRADLLGARLDLACLGIAQRLLPAGAGTAVRRLAAQVAGRCHEAARRMLGAVSGGLAATDFDELFPWDEGWAQAVLGEGLLTSAGSGYRFASAVLADWLQSTHLDLTPALALVLAEPAAGAPRGSRPEHPSAGTDPGSGPKPAPPQQFDGRASGARRRAVPQRRATPDPEAAATDAGYRGPDSTPPLGGRAVPAPRRGGQQSATWTQGGVPADAGHADPGPGLAPGPGPGPAAPPLGSRAVGAHRRGGPLGWTPPVPLPGGAVGVRGGVPRWRIGVLREALLGLAAAADPSGFDPVLGRLVLRLDGPDAAPPGTDARWWAERLLTGTLERLPDAGAHAPLLRAVAERIAYRGGDAPPFLPWEFWRRVPLTVEARLDVLRLLARTAAPEPLRLVGELIAQQPAEALPALCRWLDDDRVAGVAVETLLAHRHLALDDLAEALVSAAHPRADALLRTLAGVEPSALGRAVDRWAHDPRPERHVAAASLLPLVARAAQGETAREADRTLVRLAAEALLARADEEALHGAAFAALIRDPAARPRHLRAAVARYIAGDPLLGAAALASALDSDPVHVLAGYAARLREPGEEAAAVLAALGATPAPHARVAAARLVREHLQRRPEAARQVAQWLRARTGHGPAERESLLAFVRDLAAEHPEPVRRAFADALATVETPLGRELGGLLASRVTSPMRIDDQAHGKV